MFYISSVVEYSVLDRAGAGSNPVCIKLCLVFWERSDGHGKRADRAQFRSSGHSLCQDRTISVYRRSARKTATAVAEERKMHKGTNSNK